MDESILERKRVEPTPRSAVPGEFLYPHRETTVGSALLNDDNVLISP